MFWSWFIFACFVVYWCTLNLSSSYLIGILIICTLMNSVFAPLLRPTTWAKPKSETDRLRRLVAEFVRKYPRIDSLKQLIQRFIRTYEKLKVRRTDSAQSLLLQLNRELHEMTYELDVAINKSSWRVSWGNILALSDNLCLSVTSVDETSLFLVAYDKPYRDRILKS